MLEDPTVVFFDRQLLSWAIRGLEVFAYAETTVRVDVPREFNPELILFPHFTWIGLIGIFYRLTIAFFEDTQDWLAEADPARCMRFLAHQVMTFAPNAHGKHVIGIPCSFTPDRRQGCMEFDLLLVG